MRKTKVLYDFILYKPDVKTGFYSNVLVKLTDNPYYQNPFISLIEASDALVSFQAAIIAAADGAHTALSDMHDKEAICDEAVRVLAAYVDHESDGDETKILSSGFHPSKQPVASVKPDIVIVNGFHSGDISIKVKAILYAVAYIWQYRLYNPGAIEGEWISLPITTYARTSLTGLIPGSVYEFRFATISNAGTSEFGQSITHRVM